jgi:hypothetical protein
MRALSWLGRLVVTQHGRVGEAAIAAPEVVRAPERALALAGA